MRLDGPRRRDPPAWSRRFGEAAIIGAGRDDRVHDAGHLGGHGRICLASPVRICRIRTDVVVKLPTKAVLSHADRDRARHPEGVSQPSIPAFGQVGRAAILARLLRAEIQPAILQKLPHAAKAPEVARFGQNDQGQNRSDARDRLQPHKIPLVGQPGDDVGLQLLAPLAERPIVLEHHPKHPHRL